MTIFPPDCSPQPMHVPTCVPSLLFLHATLFPNPSPCVFCPCPTPSLGASPLEPPWHPTYSFVIPARCPFCAPAGGPQPRQPWRSHCHPFPFDAASAAFHPFATCTASAPTLLLHQCKSQENGEIARSMGGSSVQERHRCGAATAAAQAAPSSSCRASCASARLAVSPGDSMPYRLSSPGTPCAAGPCTTKSPAGWPGPDTCRQKREAG